MIKNKRLAGVLAATLLATSTAVPLATAQISNIIDAGGVNVRSLNGDQVANYGDTVNLAYQVSFGSVFNADEQNTRGVTVLVPEDAQNIEFALAGTREPHSRNPLTVGDAFTPAQPVPMDIGGGPAPSISEEVYGYDDNGFVGGVPDSDTLTQLTRRGYDTIPNGVQEIPITPGVAHNYPEGVKAFAIPSQLPGVVAVNVSFDLPVGADVSTASVRAYTEWKCSGYGFDASVGSFEEGCQSLMEYRRDLGDYGNFTDTYATPDLSKDGCVPNTPTSTWEEIGTDLAPAKFNYVEQFNLAAVNTPTTAAMAEDYCDQADVTLSPHPQANGYDDSFTYPGVDVVVQTQDVFVVYPQTKFYLKDPAPEGWTVTVDENTGQITFNAPASAAGPTRHVFTVEAVHSGAGGAQVVRELTAGVQVLDNRIVESVVERDGTIVITFTDGSVVELDKPQDGRDGVDGQDGRDGVDGVDGQDGRDGVDGVDGQDGQGQSSSAPEKCVPAVAASVVPVALVGLVGVIGQLDLPGLKPVQRALQQVFAEVQRNVQQLIGTSNTQSQSRISGRRGTALISQQDLAKLGGGVAAVIAIGIAATVVAQACAPAADNGSGTDGSGA